jgi:secreted trypsin-like serine protease
MHPSYDPDELYHDIATIRLSEAINDNGFNIGYADLPVDESNDFANTICVLTGWGRTDHIPQSPLPNILQQVNIGIITTSQCNSILSDLNNISVTPTMICAYDALHQKGSCNGDSGGPMNCPTDLGYVVAGITSWGIGSQNYACYSEYPSVYTRTSSYLSWIADNLP